MGVPFEALIPYGIMLGVMPPLDPRLIEQLFDMSVQMFMFTGGALSKIRHVQNGGKRARHSVDQWDKVSASSASIA